MGPHNGRLDADGRPRRAQARGAYRERVSYLAVRRRALDDARGRLRQHEAALARIAADALVFRHVVFCGTNMRLSRVHRGLSEADTHTM